MFRKAAYLIICLLLASCTHLLFVPVYDFPFSPDKLNIDYENIELKTSDELVLHGWKLQAKNQRKGAVLFFHGNGDNVSTQLPHTFWLVDYGYDVYIFDYRGYGISQGVVDLDNTMLDLQQMIAYVADRKLSGEQLIVMGHSLGGAMAIYAVAMSDYKNSIDGLVTLEAFSDYHDVTQDVLSKNWLFWLFQWPLSFLIDNSYSPVDYIEKVAPVPVLLAHSKEDTLVEYYHAEALYKAAHQPKHLGEMHGDHNNIFDKQENRDVVIDFLNSPK